MVATLLVKSLSVFKHLMARFKTDIGVPRKPTTSMQRRRNAGSQAKIAMARMKLLQEKNVVSIVSRANLPNMGVGGFFQEG